MYESQLAKFISVKATPILTPRPSPFYEKHHGPCGVLHLLGCQASEMPTQSPKNQMVSTLQCLTVATVPSAKPAVLLGMVPFGFGYLWDPRIFSEVGIPYWGSSLPLFSYLIILPKPGYQLMEPGAKESDSISQGPRPLPFPSSGVWQGRGSSACFSKAYPCAHFS